MDIKHVLSLSPLDPPYVTSSPQKATQNGSRGGWFEYRGGQTEIGRHGEGFCFDNETPSHSVLLAPFALADRLVTCGQWIEFIQDGGYQRPELWLSDGWAIVQADGCTAPLYWQGEGSEWTVFTLGGRRSVDPDEPVCHVSYFEADAFAHWSGARLPTEFEWEAVAGAQPTEGRFLDPSEPHPRPQDGPAWYGETWVWTASAYLPYPGFRPAARSGGGVQRQVHGQPARAAGRLLRHARGAHPLHLPQLLPSQRPLAVHRCTTRSRPVGGLRGKAVDHRCCSSRLRDRHAALGHDVRTGLSASPKFLPPVWFYDEAGSLLFDEITRLPEYYLTRAESGILTGRAAEIARITGADTLVEIGSGTSEKTRLLLDAMAGRGSLSGIVLLDISEEVLTEAAATLSARYEVDVHAVVDDFRDGLLKLPSRGTDSGPSSAAPSATSPGRAVVASGRFQDRDGSRRLLPARAPIWSKTPRRLVAAYDDAEGVTAAFNRNVLEVLNRELGANFDPDAFDHRAVWNAAQSWIEMRLRSRPASGWRSGSWRSRWSWTRGRRS